LQWASEVEQGQVRLDTITYFDREVSRFLESIQRNELVDVPSTLLLQLDRTGGAMVRINSVIKTLLDDSENRPNFIIPGERQPFLYQPYFVLLDNENAMESYLANCEAASQETRKLQPAIGNSIGKLAASLLFSPLGVVGAIAFWKFSEMRAAEARAKEKMRLQEFRAMLGLALELRSCRTLLTLATLHAETVKQIDVPNPLSLQERRVPVRD